MPWFPGEGPRGKGRHWKALEKNTVRLSQGESPHSLWEKAQINAWKENFKGNQRWGGLQVLGKMEENTCNPLPSSIWKISLWDQCGGGWVWNTGLNSSCWHFPFSAGWVWWCPVSVAGRSDKRMTFMSPPEKHWPMCPKIISAASSHLRGEDSPKY